MFPELSEVFVPPYTNPPTSAVASTPSVVTASPRITSPPQSPWLPALLFITTGKLAVPCMFISAPFSIAI